MFFESGSGGGSVRSLGSAEGLAARWFVLLFVFVSPPPPPPLAVDPGGVEDAGALLGLSLRSLHSSLWPAFHALIWQARLQ